MGTLGYAIEDGEGECMDAFELAARLTAVKRLTLDGLISHRFPLLDRQRAAAVAIDEKRHISIKVALAC